MGSPDAVACTGQRLPGSRAAGTRGAGPAAGLPRCRSGGWRDLHAAAGGAPARCPWRRPGGEDHPRPGPADCAGPVLLDADEIELAPPLLLKAAREFEPLDPRRARETYLEALAAAIFAGRLALGGGMREVAEAARMAPPSPGPARGPDLLLDGLALMICEGYPAGAPVLRQAVTAFRGTDVSTEEELRWLLLACHAALIVWDHASWDVLSERQITLARDAGALIALPIAFNMRSSVYLFAGEFSEAASIVAQAESVTEATGSSSRRTAPWPWPSSAAGKHQPLS